MLSLLWYTFVAIGIVLSAGFSIWGVVKINGELRKAVIFRTDVRRLLDVDVDDEPDPDLEHFKGEVAGMRAQVDSCVKYLNDFNAKATDLIKLPDRLNGALGQLTKKQNDVTNEAFESFDLAADQQLIASLPPFVQGIALKVVEDGDPMKLSLLRQWAATRPELQALMTGQVPQQPSPGGRSGISEIDAYL